MASPLPLSQNLALLYQAYHTQACNAGLRPLTAQFPPREAETATESQFSGLPWGPPRGLGDGNEGPREARSMSSNATAIGTGTGTAPPTATASASAAATAPAPGMPRLAAAGPLPRGQPGPSADSGTIKGCASNASNASSLSFWEGGELPTPMNMATSFASALPPSLPSLDHSQPFAAKSAQLLLTHLNSNVPGGSTGASHPRAVGPQATKAARAAATPLSGALDLAASCPSTFCRLLESGALDSALLASSPMDLGTLRTPHTLNPLNPLGNTLDDTLGNTLDTLNAFDTLGASPLAPPLSPSPSLTAPPPPHSLGAADMGDLLALLQRQPRTASTSLEAAPSPGLSTSSLGGSSLGGVPGAYRAPRPSIAAAAAAAAAGVAKTEAGDAGPAGASTAALLSMLQRLTEQDLAGVGGAPSAPVPVPSRPGAAASGNTVLALPSAAAGTPSFPSSHGALSVPSSLLLASRGCLGSGSGSSLGSGSGGLRSSVSFLPPLPSKPHHLSPFLGDAALSDGGEDSRDDADLSPKDLEARRLRRLASNRESAKRSRKRKVERLAELEVLVAQLQAEHREAQGRLEEAEAQLQRSERRNRELAVRLAGLRSSPACPGSAGDLAQEPGTPEGIPEGAPEGAVEGVPDAEGHSLRGEASHGHAALDDDAAKEGGAEEEGSEGGLRAGKRARVSGASGCEDREERHGTGAQLGGPTSEAGPRAVEALAELSEFFADDLAYDF